MKADKGTKIILFFILVACLVIYLYWGYKKEGYHVDEMYMYGTANSEYLPFMHMGEQEYSVKDWMKEYGAGENIIDLFRNLSKDYDILKANGWDVKGSEIYRAYTHARECSNDTYTTTWMRGRAYKDYIAASESNRFNYISVLYNFRGDNHPPLYALLLHTVCSFFPGIYSKWFGLGLNIVIGLLAVLLLYRTVERFLGGRETALMAALLYGLSAAAAITASYIRMYSLVTLMVIGVAYAHLNLASKDWEWDKKDRRTLVFFTLCAYLSQYYSVIYIFGIALASVLVMLLRKKIKPMLRYILTMVLTGAAGIAMWPFSIKAVFKGSRGAESIGGFFSLEGTGDRLGTMLYVLVHNCLGIPEWLFIILSLIVCVLFAVILIKQKQEKDRLRAERALIVTFPFIVYFVCVSKMVPYLVDRYIMCIMPWCGVLLLCGIMFIIKRLLKGKKAAFACAVCFIPMLIFSDSLLVGNGEVYAGGQECDEIAEGTDCIYILPDGWWNESAEDTLLLSKCRDTAVVFEGNADVLSGTYDAAVGSELLMVVHRGVETGDNIDAIAGKLTPSGTELKEKSRESVRGNTWIYYEVVERKEADTGKTLKPDKEEQPASSGILSSAEEINLGTADGSSYTFTYDGVRFEAVFDKDTWKIIDSYKINNTDDMVIICSALQKEHPVHIGDTEELRTPEDMALEWAEHNMAYAFFKEGSEWSERAKDVDLDPYDVGKSFEEMYEDRTGKKFDINDLLK